MNLKKYFFRLVLFLIALLQLFPHQVFSQNPGHFYIGQKELANIDVFSIVYAKSQLLASTNKGLFVYHNRIFKKVKFKDSDNNSSLFSLVKNFKGEVFCCNLTGKIFQFKSNQLELYCQVPKQYLNSVSMLGVDESDHLVFCSNGYYLIDSNKVSLIHKNENTTGHLLSKLGNGKLIGASVDDKSVMTLNKGKASFSSVTFPTDKLKEEPFSSYTFLNNTWIKFAKTLMETQNDGAFEKRIEGINAYATQYNNNGFWCRGKQQGVTYYQLDKEENLTGKTFFDKHFISAVFEENGLVFLGTFGQGIIVVPRLPVESVQFEKAQKIRSIAAGKEGVFVADIAEGVQRVDKHENQLLVNNKSANHSKVFYIEGVDFGLNKDFPGLCYYDDYDYRTGAIKDICFSDNKVFYATSKGLFASDKITQNGWSRHFSERVLWKYDSINSRCRAVAFDKENRKLYISTSEGLIEVGSDGKKKELTYNSKKIYANDLAYSENKLWSATSNGLLVIEEGTEAVVLDEDSGFLDNNFQKIVIDSEDVFLLNNNQLVLTNKDASWIKPVTSSDGLVGSVNDFSIAGNKVWVVLNNNKITSVDIKVLKENKKLELKLDSVLIGGELLNSELNYDFNKNKLEIYFSDNQLTDNQGTFLNIQIKGLQDKWTKHDVKQNSLVFNSLPPGKYTLNAYLNAGTLKSNKVTFSFNINPPVWQRWWFYLLIGLITIGIVSLFYSYRIKQLNLKNQEKLEKQTLKTDLLETELKALRSQMNPHFIFNSLNSIQDLVLQQDTDASYDYLVLFAELVRNTLSYSNQNFIPLPKEVGYLRTYLELEKLRFGNELTYTIEVKESDEVKIPSLLVQPFIENALIHGLLHKQGEKKLEISFEEKDDQFICCIVDNGVGRKAASEIQNRQGKNHESFALQSITKRLKILEQQHPGVGYTMEDLYEERKSTGTKVIIAMPFVKGF